MPRLAFAQSFWDGYDALEKPVRAGVRKAMAKFQAMSAAELNADKGLHLESVENARDKRMRTIRVTDFWRGVVLAPDDGSDVFLLVNVLPHDDAYTWAAKRLYSANSATRALEVRDAVALDELTPLYENAARSAPPAALRARLRRRAARTRHRRPGAARRPLPGGQGPAGGRPAPGTLSPLRRLHAGAGGAECDVERSGEPVPGAHRLTHRPGPGPVRRTESVAARASGW
jgi:hypothetical protein